MCVCILLTYIILLIDFLSSILRNSTVQMAQTENIESILQVCIYVAS